MISSNFNFLKAEWPAVHEAAAKAESYVLSVKWTHRIGQLGRES